MYLYIFPYIFFKQVNDKSIMPHRHNIFSNNERKTEDYKKHINNFTACSTRCCCIYISFVPFSFLHNWLKTKALSHKHIHTPSSVYGIWVCGQPKLRVLRIFLLSVCLAIIHVRHLVSLFPALWCHIKPSQVSAPRTQLFLLIRHVVRYDYVESVLPTKLQQLCATHTHTIRTNDNFKQCHSFFVAHKFQLNVAYWFVVFYNVICKFIKQIEVAKQLAKFQWRSTG